MVSTGKSGLEAKVAGTSPNRSLHVPKWLLRIGLGTAVLAALTYGAVQLATATPQPRSNAQPTAVATPYQQPTPAVSQYQKQALEQIAAIGQKEPGLAELLPRTKWFSDGIIQQEAEFVTKLRDYIEQGNYATGMIAQPDGSITNILVVGKDKDKRDQSLAITQNYLPKVANLLRINYKEPLLTVHLFGEGGGADFERVNITNPDDLEHELVHTVFENPWSNENPRNSRLGQVPPWLVEGVPEFVLRYLRGGDVIVEIARKNLNNPSRGIIKPLFDISLKLGNHQDIYEGGLLFLAEYKKLVGYDNFWDALKHVHEWRVAKGLTPQRIIINKDLENPSDEVKAMVKQQHEELEVILRQHVPSGNLFDFTNLYQQRVYGVREMKP